MMMERCTYSGIVGELTGSTRLDRYIAEHIKLLSRSQIKSRTLEAKCNGRPVKISRPVKTGDSLELCWLPAAPLYLEPENIPLDVIYEDTCCAVINKSQGIVVHPGAGNYSGTLANALLWRRLHQSNKNTNVDGLEAVMEKHEDSGLLLPGYRNGIVHRLDKDTSGVIIAAYNDTALAFLSAQFKERTVRKQYLALVQGKPVNEEGSIKTRMIRDPRDRKRFTAIPAENKTKGKIALTKYRTLKTWTGYSLLLLKPKTGRTHQLRVHLQYLGHSILGDPVYNPLYIPGRTARDTCFPDARLMLHASSLAIVLPGESEQRVFKAPLPDRFTTIIAGLNGRKG